MHNRIVLASMQLLRKPIGSSPWKFVTIRLRTHDYFRRMKREYLLRCQNCQELFKKNSAHIGKCVKRHNVHDGTTKDFTQLPTWAKNSGSGARQKNENLTSTWYIYTACDWESRFSWHGHLAHVSQAGSLCYEPEDLTRTQYRFSSKNFSSHDLSQ